MRITGFDTMARITELLDSILQELRKYNPYGLVLKGGTALAIHHLNNHRESEDLDFDIDKKYFEEVEEVAEFIIGILDSVVKKGILKSYEIRKKGLASTSRYHMNLTLVTYKPIYSKIDLDFVELPVNLEYEGELGFYSTERMFVGKLLTYASRKGLKDFYDVSHLLKRVEPASFEKQEKLASLIDKVIDITGEEHLILSYKTTLRNIDLRFYDLKETNLESFIERTIRQMRTFRNELLKHC